MTPAMIVWLVELGLSLPDLAMKIQKMLMVQQPSQSDWDEVWAIIAKTPADYLKEARARLGQLPPPPPA